MAAFSGKAYEHIATPRGNKIDIKLMDPMHESAEIMIQEDSPDIDKEGIREGLLMSRQWL